MIGNASNVAGLVVNATNTQISNSSFTGVIQANEKQGKEYNVGGLVANLKGGDSLLSQSRADVTILAGARANNQRFGGLVGRLENNARISRSYVTGKIQNTTKNGQIGGIVGSNYFNGLVDNVISNISGTNVIVFLEIKPTIMIVLQKLMPLKEIKRWKMTSLSLQH